MADPTIYGTDGPDTITGTAKADSIYGGGGADTIRGGGGNDTLNGGYATDKLYGEAGDDFLDNDRDSFAGRELFDGGDGNDTLRASFRFSGFKHTINLGTSTFSENSGKAAPTIVSIENVIYLGTDVTLTGSAADNRLSALANEVKIDAQGGNDVIAVSSLNAVIDGGDGTDWLLLERAEAEPKDYRGFAVSLARPGLSQLTGYATGAKIIVSNVENLAGSGLDDKLTGNAGANVIVGLDGNDSLIGGAGDDTLVGDTLATLPASPWTYEDLGYLFPRGVLANDDMLEGGLGNDKLVGGIGYDTISYANAAGSVTVNLIDGKASGADGNDTITGVEAVIGSAYADQLTGDGEANLLEGGAGIDTMAGGGGDDTYGVDSADDVVTELVNAGNDTVRSSVTWKLADDLENITLVGSANIDATGNAGANILTGNAGQNRLTGGLGDDIYVISQAGSVVTERLGGGHDTVRSAITMTLGAHVEDLELTGTRAINGTGNTLANRITGNDTANRIDGGVGADTMAGGRGSDTYYVDNVGDTIIEVENTFGVPFKDEVFASVSYTLSAFVENLTLTGARALNGTGNAIDNVITGNDAANVLRGGGSNNKGDTLIGNGGNDTLIADTVYDTLKGGTGDDTYIFDHGARAIIENADEGIDTMIASFSFGLARNVENAVYTGTVSGQLRGNELDNRLTTGGGSDYLDGKEGADLMIGGAGWDTYLVNNTGDRIIEAAIPGDIDTVYASADYTMQANVEILYSTATRATGNAGDNEIRCDAKDNVIDGGRGADRMDGYRGNDTYYVDNIGDVIIEDQFGDANDSVFSTVDYALGAGVENLTLLGSALRAIGNSEGNVLIGNARNNELIGYGGADTMIGGAGNDRYVVSDGLDQIQEKAGEGADTVASSVSYTLGDNLEYLVLDGDAAIDGTGNALGNRITGNTADNRIDGRAGADIMVGGGGFDTFVVDNAGDTVSGTGAVEASVGFTLASGLSNLTLTGKLAINGTGNAGDNTLTGNDAANVLTGLDGNDRLDGGAGADTLAGGIGNDRLDGGTGADTMDGGLGDDTYYVDSAADKVSETGGGGLDRVITQTSIALGNGIEGCAATGSNAITITGNDGDNILGGGAGSATLDGGDGIDTLVAGVGGATLKGGAGDDTLIGVGAASIQTGGSGRDTFIGSFDGTSSPPTTITDFVSGTDRFVLVNPFFSATILPEGFVLGTTALDGNDIAIYDKVNGALYADLDGNGSGQKVLIASFTPGTNLTAGDIQLISQNDYNDQVFDAINWLYNGIMI